MSAKKLFTGQKPARQDLGVYRDPKGREKPLELVVTAAKLQQLARSAVASLRGLAAALGGGVVVRVKREGTEWNIKTFRDAAMMKLLAFGVERAAALRKGDSGAALEALAKIDEAAAELLQHRDLAEAKARQDARQAADREGRRAG